MRHFNPHSSSYCSHDGGYIVDKPYEHQYINSYFRNQFAKASPKKTYVKVLQYIADHDGCSRRDIITDVLGKRNTSLLTNEPMSNAAFRMLYRGQHSNMFSQLLYIDVIDYDDKYRYHIRPRGIEVLKHAYANDTIDKLF